MDFVHRPYVPGETIAAIATPPGEGGIAIVRISGTEAFAVTKKICKSPIDSLPSHTAHLTKIYDFADKMVDEVLLLLFRTPRSFTGEDTVEIHCHGGSLITKKVLSLALQAGARAALPGEFSFKAFMNGKIDLAKAEAIQQMIQAKNEGAYAASNLHLQGALSQKVRHFQNTLLHIAAILEAWVDFPEEGLEFASEEEILATLEGLQREMHILSSSFFEGKILHEGLSLCLVGPPNAGKSSLMNALLSKERAIVTDIPGTTRDLLEDQLLLAGLHFRLIDTAGIRETQEKIEQEGIRRSKEAMSSSDLVLLVLDASAPLCEESKKLLASLPPSHTLVVWNKMDISKDPMPPLTFPSVHLSALTGAGLEDLKTALHTLVWEKGPPSKEELVLTKERHKRALDEAISHLNSLQEGLRHKVSPEFLTFDCKKALFELGTILGMNISEEILSKIFSTFCVGK